MPVDNEIYNAPGDIWWDEQQPLHAIRTSLNPARMEYFAGVFAARGLDPSPSPPRGRTPAPLA